MLSLEIAFSLHQLTSAIFILTRKNSGTEPVSQQGNIASQSTVLVGGIGLMNE